MCLRPWSSQFSWGNLKSQSWPGLGHTSKLHVDLASGEGGGLGVMSWSGICDFSQWQWPPTRLLPHRFVAGFMCNDQWENSKNHNAIFQCNPINNSSNTVVLRFGCLSGDHLKPEINYSLLGVRKDHSAIWFLLKLIQCLMTYLKFSTIWWFCCVFICCVHRWLENKITHLPPQLVSSAPSGPEAGQLKHQAAKSPSQSWTLSNLSQAKHRRALPK